MSSQVMIPLAQAQDRVLTGCSVLPVVTVSIAEARGLLTAETVTAPEPVPSFDNTAMDGFAVRSQDVVGAPITLTVVGTVSAGATPSVVVGANQAARVMTGAVIPPGADAVVMVELTQASGDSDEVKVAQAVPKGNHIRRAGEDIVAGQVVFGSGEVLTPGHLGVLASLGVYEVQARPRPRVGVLSTGDELVDGCQPLKAGQIRDSNRHTLLALLDEAGCEPVDLGCVPDDESQIADAIRIGAECCHGVLTSGGVSMGDYDYVKKVLNEMGDMSWMQVAIKPAKPLAFGLVDGVPVFGLPGNPVSSMVSFELFVLPALRKMMGHPPESWHRQVTLGRTAEKLSRHPDGKTHFARVKVRYVDGEYLVSSAGGQGSHQMSAMANANALAVLPDGEGLEADEAVSLLILR
ncbi:MAG: molybdopterin molybdotransferase MoeA [Acidimicrobiia bacterium]|nr:molybdopterin molybdotransferase MoeA [Acidimicrobiia bacterium]MYC57035.1 molybdopterin molybdotransferase MoeA [Acidimicrobiia bacterium]MYG93542.1 molybdopterin molybdotransferase MoeA [Acidimicrobiia bacterium]MYI31104.1 molybdopterin molybdotransferase MoeA [Acidimicrobiia bacterium]